MLSGYDMIFYVIRKIESNNYFLVKIEYDF